MNNRHVFSFAASLLALSLLGACVDYSEQAYVERPVADLYNSAMDRLQLGDFRDASAMFDEVERQHPYSTWATKAQLMAAYSLYQNDDYDQALVALERFIQLHPSHRDIAYAHYLKALSYYEQISDVSRDQLMTKLAMESLKEVIARFPDSKYARDAMLKLDLTKDHMAGKEMEVGRYYLNQGHYLAAINRFKTVVDKYQTTSHVPEALHRLTESYYALGIDDEARKSTAVLGHNFPGSEWYIDAYETVEEKQFRPVDKPSWYEVWKSEPTARVQKLPLPEADEDSWYQFWKPTEDASKEMNAAKEKEKTVVKKPASEKNWYKFWKPEPNKPEPEEKKDPPPTTVISPPPTTAKSQAPEKKEDKSWYVFW